MRTRPFPVSLSALAISAMLMAPTLAHAADTLIFQRGDALYIAMLDKNGKISGEPRRLFAVGNPKSTLWAASADGKKIAYLRQGKTAQVNDEGEGEEIDATELYVSERGGGNEKKLFAANTLTNLQGKPVTRIADLGPVATAVPVSLAWSADGRTLYLGMTGAKGSGRVTVAVDATTGTPFVDARGQWKVIASMTEVEAQGGKLVGVGGECAYPDGSRRGTDPSNTWPAKDDQRENGDSGAAFAFSGWALYYVWLRLRPLARRSRCGENRDAPCRGKCQ